MRVGHTDVFSGEDDDAPGDEQRVLARFQHPGEPVDRGVGIRGAHGLDERGDGLVVGVAVLVVHRGAALQDLFHEVAAHPLDAGVVRPGDVRRELESVEDNPCVARGDGQQEAERIVVELDALASEPALRVGERPLRDERELAVRERLEPEHPCARKERGDNLERGVLGGRADEGDRAVLDVRENRVLLGFVEAVDLVEEEDRAAVVGAANLAGLLDGAAEIGDAGGDGGQGDEVAPGEAAMRRARVVFPTPGGPQRTMEGT